MSPSFVALFVGGALSVLLEVLPFIAQAWDKLAYKREVLLGACLLAPFGLYALSCNGLDFTQEVACPVDAFKTVIFYYTALKVGIAAFVGSQIVNKTVSYKYDLPK
mgnify:CR=1 FL=1